MKNTIFIANDVGVSDEYYKAPIFSSGVNEK